MINKILRTDFSNTNKLVVSFEVVDEEPEEMALKYSDLEECHRIFRFSREEFKRL